MVYFVILLPVPDIFELYSVILMTEA